MRKLPNMLRADEDSGEFEPKGWFLELDALAQLEILNDWKYDVDQYHKHLLSFQFFALEKKKGDERSREQKQAAFRMVMTNMGFDIPDDFESFVDAHRGTTSVPIKPCSCPICNPAYD